MVGNRELREEGGGKGGDGLEGRRVGAIEKDPFRRFQERSVIRA